jgi:hypothetical protein
MSTSTLRTCLVMSPGEIPEVIDTTEFLGSGPMWPLDVSAVETGVEVEARVEAH